MDKCIHCGLRSHVNGICPWLLERQYIEGVGWVFTVPWPDNRAHLMDVDASRIVPAHQPEVAAHR